MWTDDERRAFEAEMIFDEKCATGHRDTNHHRPFLNH
jgi:hypothetical protein